MIGCSEKDSSNMRHCNAYKSNRSAKCSNTTCQYTCAHKYYCPCKFYIQPDTCGIIFSKQQCIHPLGRKRTEYYTHSVLSQVVECIAAWRKLCHKYRAECKICTDNNICVHKYTGQSLIHISEPTRR